MGQHGDSAHSSDSNLKVTCIDIDVDLLNRLDRTRTAYLDIASSCTSSKHPKNLSAIALERITQSLAKIGLDKSVIQTMLDLASDAWELIVSPNDGVTHLHPNMRRDLDEVRQGLLIQADKKMAGDSAPAILTSKAIYDILQQTMDPANLYTLIDEISTPWIVLPRAFTALDKDEVHYLPAYLDMIEQETNEEALHIFTRIAIEFFANFTIRFANQDHPRDRVFRFVSTAYEAMFWKNLQSPPKGYEDVRIFEHFLSWFKYSDCHSGSSASAAVAVAMETAKSQIFASQSDNVQNESDHIDSCNFLIALRHGCLGIASSIRYFRFPLTGPLSLFESGMAWGRILFALKALFELIAQRYDTESDRTRYFIRDFLFQLRIAFDQPVFQDSDSADPSDSGLQFTKTRIIAIIDQLQHSLT